MEKANATKGRREKQLRWQSWTVVGIVLAGCAYDLLVNLLGRVASAKYLWLALALSCALGTLVYLVRAATRWGAALGALITFQLLCFIGAESDFLWNTCLQSGLMPEVVLFVLTFLATRFRKVRKEALDIAEGRSGRSLGQVAANLGPAILAMLTMQFYLKIFLPSFGAPGNTELGTLLLYPYKSFGPELCILAMIAALAEATADTLSSELGQVLGGDPWMIHSFERVPAGTDGAVSLSGTVAGALGAAMVVLAGAFAFHLNVAGSVIAFSAAIIGFFVDSLLGATLEQRGWLNNDAVNFISGSVAMKLAALLSLLEIEKILTP